ncbi:threonine dehydratase [Brasilonema sp. CT11]|nr:threonine dehydratase [Brasilonema sp. CT11]
MSGLKQVFQNFFIRIGGFFSVVFGSISNFIGNIFGIFGKLFGVSDAGYFLEADQIQGIKRETTQQSIKTEPSKATETPATSNRRPNPQMDYYRKMAQEMKKK